MSGGVLELRDDDVKTVITVLVEVVSGSGGVSGGGAGGRVSGGVLEVEVKKVMTNTVVVVEVVGGSGDSVVGATLDATWWMRESCKKRMTALFDGRGGGV